MKKLRRIVATTDLSSESLSAVLQALELAKDQGASVTIVHVPVVVETPSAAFGVAVDFGTLSWEIEASARKTLEHWIERNAKSVRTNLVLRHGLTHEAICAVAKEVGADLLVMATHGRKGIGHVVLGSVTERVLREAPCPVLVVKPVVGATAKKATPRLARAS
jgi:nucleotide-binding universal stress UspA family protein